MLRVLTMALMMFHLSQASQDVRAAADSLEHGRQDTIRDERSVTILRNRAFQEMPGFRTPNSALFGTGQPLQQLSSSALDSLFQSRPSLREPLLEELIMPKGQPLEDPTQVALRKFNEQLVKDSKFTPFERMSLIAKRQADLYRWDNSIRWYQLDILGTIRWLQEALK